MDAYREVANRQKQEIGELRKQVDDASSRSSDAYAELDSANARALRQRDRLEELEEMVCSYRDRAHVAEGLIRQYPEDEGLYEVELPSLSEVQRKLDASEALVRQLATFAHRLYRADPANLLHYHNRYVGGLLEAITLLLYRGLHHTPERLSSVIDIVLGYLSQARFTSSVFVLLLQRSRPSRGSLPGDVDSLSFPFSRRLPHRRPACRIRRCPSGVLGTSSP